MATMDTHDEREQLDELVRAVREGVHELNNLLGVVRNFTTLVEMRIDDHPVAPDIAVIREAAAKAIDTVGRLSAACTAAATGRPA